MLALSIIFGLFATTAACGPVSPPDPVSQRCGPDCLTQNDVTQLVEVYRRLIAAYDQNDLVYIADNFIEYSDSINTLSGQPLGSPTFPHKAAFNHTQSTFPPFPLKVEGVKAVDCMSIAVTWSGAFGQAAKSVRGVTAIQATRTGGGRAWQISRLDVEFNSLMWLNNVGGSFTMPSAPS